VVILRMRLQVLGQVVDALGQHSDLNLGGTCVAFVGSVLLHNRGFFFG
jgi:hypothetical protein